LQEKIAMAFKIKILKKTIDILNKKLTENRTKQMDDTIRYYKGEIEDLNREIAKLKELLSRCSEHHDAAQYLSRIASLESKLKDMM
jgi:peptidoglycan hydrolase CwlO-like protein